MGRTRATKNKKVPSDALTSEEIVILQRARSQQPIFIGASALRLVAEELIVIYGPHPTPTGFLVGLTDAGRLRLDREEAAGRAALPKTILASWI